MTNKDKQLFEILRYSLWDSMKQHVEIPPDIRRDLHTQAVEGLTAKIFPDKNNLKYTQAAHFILMDQAQNEAVHLLQQAGIPVVVIKGTAAGIYYPQPQLRSYGDIDLLVKPEDYHYAAKALCAGDWQQDGEIGHYHTTLTKNNQLIELHQCPPGLDDVKEGSFIHQFLLSGFSDIQQGTITQLECSFPMLPWQQNGLELIWHFREHLYNGIGLRHAIDWMMFVHSCLDDQTFSEYKNVLERAGLLFMAKTVARMCQLYLGLEKSITWCMDVNESLCTDLMEFILDQGNFGNKRTDDKVTKVLSRYHTPLSFLKGMQNRGIYSWDLAKKYRILRPIAWIYTAVQGVKTLYAPSERKRIAERKAEIRKRRALFTQLYGRR